LCSCTFSYDIKERWEFRLKPKTLFLGLCANEGRVHFDDKMLKILQELTLLSIMESLLVPESQLTSPMLASNKSLRISKFSMYD
jgi:hypothetical protein